MAEHGDEADRMRALPEGTQLVYLAEGAANIVYRLEPASNGLHGHVRTTRKSEAQHFEGKLLLCLPCTHCTFLQL